MNLHQSSDTLRTGVPSASAKSALILIHGRGASAADIAGLADYLPKQGLAVIAPEAREGWWYPQRFFVPLAENEPWLTSSVALIEQTVTELIADGIPAEKIGVAGFSQGGCLALEYAVRHPRRYGLVAGLSGALIGPAGIPRATADLQGTPVLVACAESDPHIPLPFVRDSVTLMKGFKGEVTEQIHRGSDHTVFAEEIEWLKERINGWNAVAV
ncbi:MAG: phospholipase [Akkermansiaceae bacterium]|nr:phospholipase [Akkermansiaceae bacterium]